MSLLLSGSVQVDLRLPAAGRVSKFLFCLICVHLRLSVVSKVFAVLFWKLAASEQPGSLPRLGKLG